MGWTRIGRFEVTSNGGGADSKVHVEPERVRFMTLSAQPAREGLYVRDESRLGGFVIRIVDEPSAEQPLAQETSAAPEAAHPESVGSQRLARAVERLQRALRSSQHPASQDQTTSRLLALGLAEELDEVSVELEDLSRLIKSQSHAGRQEVVDCLSHIEDSSEDIPF